jgi:hypothetical protein
MPRRRHSRNSISDWVLPLKMNMYFSALEHGAVSSAGGTVVSDPRLRPAPATPLPAPAAPPPATCSQNGYLSSRGGCQKRWHSPINLTTATQQIDVLTHHGGWVDALDGFARHVLRTITSPTTTHLGISQPARPSTTPPNQRVSPLVHRQAGERSDRRVSVLAPPAVCLCVRMLLRLTPVQSALRRAVVSLGSAMASTLPSRCTARSASSKGSCQMYLLRVVSWPASVSAPHNTGKSQSIRRAARS